MLGSKTCFFSLARQLVKPPCAGYRGIVSICRLPVIKCPAPLLVCAAVQAGRERPGADKQQNYDDDDDDSVAGMYNPTEDPEIENLLQRWERGELPSTGPNSSEDFSPEAKLMREMNQRKAVVLMDLMRAGPNLQECLQKHQAELDPQLLFLLDRRIEAARDLGEPRQSQELLQELHRVLVNEVQRVQASPALRLIDSLLEALGDEVATEDYEERKEQCAARMREAFNGQVGGIDIFRAAAAFASREPVALDEFQTERVNIQAFLEECRDLLISVTKQQNDVQRQLEVADRKLQKLTEGNPQVLDRPDMQQRILILEQARASFEQRKVVATQLEDMWTIAEALESHNVHFSS